MNDIIEIIICIGIGITASCICELYRKQVNKRCIDNKICPFCKKELRKLESGEQENEQLHICETCNICVFISNNKQRR